MISVARVKCMAMCNVFLQANFNTRPWCNFGIHVSLWKGTECALVGFWWGKREKCRSDIWSSKNPPCSCRWQISGLHCFSNNVSGLYLWISLLCYYSHLNLTNKTIANIAPRDKLHRNYERERTYVRRRRRRQSSWRTLRNMRARS